MKLMSDLAWGVAILILAGIATKTTTRAFVQNHRKYRRCAQIAYTNVQKLQRKSFETPILSSRRSKMFSNTDQAEEADPDLFDYFDPLLSPHAYPSGISPEKKSPFENNDEIQQERQNNIQQYNDRGSNKGFGFDLPNVEQTTDQKSTPATKGKLGFKVGIEESSSYSSETKEKEENKDKDLFDYFDPLRSPHEYPDGIKSNTDMISSVTAPPSLEVVEDNGKRKKVGVLLMDHGSKKEKSNARLQAMAKLYQLTLDGDEDVKDDTTPTIIVRASHMEIATPSIPDGLKELRDLGVDEIICHPFFLSADGRHVSQDIPEIIETAIEELWGKNSGAAPIPIVTTAPVGSNTQLMLGAIHSLVRENSTYLKTSLQN